MRRMRWIVWIVLGNAATAHAHTFAAPYTLPVPFWMYAYGASAALILSFVVVGIFSQAPRTQFHPQEPIYPLRINDVRASPWFMLPLLRSISVFLLCMTIATGLIGSNNPFTNFNMTFFWIIFVMGFAYLTAVIGDIYRFLNPWRLISEVMAARFPLLFQSFRRTYPLSWGYYPALLLYMAFIWLELFGHLTPRGLSTALLVYTVITLVGSLRFGIDSWFRYAEFFSVFLRLIGLMAPIAYEVTDQQSLNTSKAGIRIRLRLPFVGLLEERASHISLVVFILFMLSSTAYDGMHDSAPWSNMFWRTVYPMIEPLVKATSAQPYVLAASIFHNWQWLTLLLSPLFYLVFYCGVLILTKRLTGSAVSLTDLALQFSYSLVPIAFVYHFTHYYTLLLSQGMQVVHQISDPFGFGWNLFGTATSAQPALLVDANVVWHTQVGFILIGHVVSVYLAHIEAINIFNNGYRAMMSQLPMLLLMVSLTSIGLWILSLPIASV